MGHRRNTTYHRTKEEAEAAQAEACGLPGYSEVYKRGVEPCIIIDPETGRTMDGWRSDTEEFYG